MSETKLEGQPGAATFLVETSSELDAVEPQWAALEDGGTAFQSRAWLRAWFRIVAPPHGATPLFVTVRDGATRRPLMLLPLCRRRRHGLMTIEFPDIEVSDYNAPLLAPDFAPTEQEFADLWEQIRQALPPADLMRFDKMPPVVQGRDNPLAGLSFVRELELRAWLLPLPATRAEYEERAQTKKNRKESRRKRKNLVERMGEVAIHFAETASEGEEIFAALRAERRARYGMQNLLEHPCFREFYRAVIFEPWGSLAMMSALKAGDRILATQFALRQKDVYLLIMHAFEPELEPLSAGMVAIDEMISNRIKAGAKGFDFTVGNEGYKRMFGVEPRALFGGLLPMSPAGRLYAFALPHARRARKALGRAYRDLRDRSTLKPRPGPQAPPTEAAAS